MRAKLHKPVSLFPSNEHRSQHGFTLIEMLIAMAVTLLLSAALATGFAYVGQNIKDGRGDVLLSNQLRDVTTRLRNELDYLTVQLDPSAHENGKQGYFLYYEGPVTDATSAIFGVEEDIANKQILPSARYGDFDDYLAFTAVATGDKWFTGKVPRFVLDQKTAENNAIASGTFDPRIDYYNPAAFDGDPWDPVVIRSKYAEIIYFASPEYETASLPGNPTYVDTDGDGFPDRLRLHRRVLLIRPDLNLAHGSLRNWPPPTGGTPGQWQRNYNGVEFMLADAYPGAGDSWLYGMAAPHQQCDLSLRRVLDNNGVPTLRVAANSLPDLALPHNRFAHVRARADQVGLSNSPMPNINQTTTMPILALGSPATILTRVNGGGATIAPPGSNALSPSPYVLPQRWSGFIRPEFVLGMDLAHFDSPLDSWGRERLGEDMIANNLIGFDLKVFDPDAISITTSSGLLASPNDAGFREALIEYTSAPNVNNLIRGSFVDLAYPVLAGGSLRGWRNTTLLHRLSTAGSPAVSRPLLITPFSGIKSFPTTTDPAQNDPAQTYTDSLYRSGRVVVVGGAIRLFQPAFDTFTNYYESDGRVQGFVRTGLPITAATVGGGGVGTRWTASTDLSLVDLGTNGLDDDGVLGADTDYERETLPPFQSKAPAIQISVRLENLGNRQFKQSSVVYRDPK